MHSEYPAPQQEVGENTSRQRSRSNNSYRDLKEVLTTIPIDDYKQVEMPDKHLSKHYRVYK